MIHILNNIFFNIYFKMNLLFFHFRRSMNFYLSIQMFGPKWHNFWTAMESTDLPLHACPPTTQTLFRRLFYMCYFLYFLALPHLLLYVLLLCAKKSRRTCVLLTLLYGGRRAFYVGVKLLLNLPPHCRLL